MPVMIGVDPHKASHTAAALDEHGHLLGQQRIAAALDEESSRVVDGRAA